MPGYEYGQSKRRLPALIDQDINTTPEVAPVNSELCEGSILPPVTSKLPQRSVFVPKIPTDLRISAPCETTEEGRRLFNDPVMLDTAKVTCEGECPVSSLECITATVIELQSGNTEALNAVQVRGGMALSDIKKLAGLAQNVEMQLPE